MGVSNGSRSHSEVILSMGFMKFLPLEMKIETNILCVSTASSPATPACTGVAAKKEGVQDGLQFSLAEGNGFSPEAKLAMPSLSP